MRIKRKFVESKIRKFNENAIIKDQERKVTLHKENDTYCLDLMCLEGIKHYESLWMGPIKEIYSFLRGMEAMLKINP